MKNILREKRLAEIFLDHSLRLKRHDRLVLATSDFQPAELILECYIGALERGAHVYLDVAGLNLVADRSSVCDLASEFYKHAQGHQLNYMPEVFYDIARWGNKFLRITSVEEPEHVAWVESKKIQMRRRALSKAFEQMVKKDWVLTYTPTRGMARQAKMSLLKLEDFYYKSVLVDYKKMERDLRGLTAVIDRGREIYLKGYRTDLRLGIKGRRAEPCYGQCNIPDGEVFTGPEETKTEGYVYFDFPGLYSGREIKGIYLEFKAGRVVKCSAESNEKALREILETDSGARRLGEFAIGANYEIKNFMYNTLFDEKIGGTVHMALGRSYKDRKGLGNNVSVIHWDIVKDTRKRGSELWIDNKLILKDGKILV